MADDTERRRLTDRRRMGRPPLTPGQRGVSLSTTVPAAVYDALVAQATDVKLPLAVYTRMWLTAIATHFSTEKSTHPPERVSNFVK